MVNQKQDLDLIRHAYKVAERSRSKGNHPFGAVLVDKKGIVLLEAENTVVTEKDSTGHAELNLMRLATQQYSQDFLANCTIYTSTEPCPMCTGAIFWSNVRRIVYGLSEQRLYELVGSTSEEVLSMSCKDLLAKGKKQIEVVGPLLEEEAEKVHGNFWNGEVNTTQ